jgi:hypothetical protein
LRAALQRLLADPALGARLGLAGREHVRAHFTAGAVVPQLEELYRGVIAGSRDWAGARSATLAYETRGETARRGLALDLKTTRPTASHPTEDNPPPTPPSASHLSNDDPHTSRQPAPHSHNHQEP